MLISEKTSLISKFCFDLAKKCCYFLSMALTSSSTLSDALAQYNDNLSWDGDATKATNALEAIRWLLINRAQATSRNGRTINFAALEIEKKKLESYVNEFGTNANRTSFTRGRMCL